MERIASVSRSKDGYSLEVREIPERILMMRTLVTGPLEWVMANVLRHWLCCKMPGWTFRLGWDKPEPGDADYDPDDHTYRRHSLGGGLYHFSSWLAFYGYKKEKEILRLPLTEAQVLESFPEWKKWNAEDEEAPGDAASPAPGSPAS